MSGVEIVGVVLAIFPLVTEAIKFYTDGPSLVDYLLRYEGILKRIGRDVTREQTIFGNSCKRFMDDIASQCGIEEEEIAEMIQNPQDPRWKEKDFFQEQVFNQKFVQQYLEAVEDMKEEMAKIERMTVVEDKDKSESRAKKPRRRHWKKIILMLNQGDINRSLKKAERLNHFLLRLTTQSQSPTPTRRLARRSTKHYPKIRSHAMDLYEILQDRFPSSPSCSCMLRHDVNMKLEFRSARITAKELYFRAIFTSDALFPVPLPTRNWREIEMEPWGTTDSNAFQDAATHSRVKFTLDILTPPHTPPPAYDDISNLCETITKPSSQEWLGSITGKKGQQHRIRAIDCEQRLLSCESIGSISLAHILRNKSFRQEQRSRLGLKLASSVMQLHTTKWWMDHWNKHDILFPCSLNATIDFDSPFIRRSFGEQSMELALRSKTAPKPYLHASIPCLFSLGIVLLELWYRDMFEELKSEDERQLPLQFSDPVAARRLADEMDCGPNYKHSVLRCITGLDAIYTSLEEGKFQEEVEQKILSPLEEDLKFYCNKPSIEECM